MSLCCSVVFFLLLCSICLEASNRREGKITGGHEARPHSHPYVVSLQNRYLWKRYYRLCTGSILSERWILSSGHCVTDSWAKWLALDAIIGAHNLARITTSMIYPISHRIAHPLYSGGVGPYDIAMMRTSRDIRFSDTVQPIRLPITSTNTYHISDDLLITGWGALQSNFFYSEIPTKLQEAKVSYLPYIDCYRAVDRLKESYERNPLKRYHNICTGPTYGGIAGCTGDSGGPLVRYISVTNPQISETGTGAENTTPMTSTRPANTIASLTTGMSSSTTTKSTSYMTTMYTTTATPSTSASSTRPSSTSASSTTPSSTTASSTTSVSDTADMTTEEETIALATTTAETAIEAQTIIASRKKLRYIQNNNEIDSGNKRSIYYLPPMNASLIPTVVGVISWGVVPCGIRGAPTVYSNVSHYMDFINKYLYS